jgi:hypothetical protein
MIRFLLPFDSSILRVARYRTPWKVRRGCCGRYLTRLRLGTGSMPFRTYDLSVKVRPWEFGSSPRLLKIGKRTIVPSAAPVS